MPLVIGGFGSGLGGDDPSDSEDGSQPSHPSSPREGSVSEFLGVMAEALECPVCMTLPEGEVHQCNEGHCYCVECWNRLDPRRCPECRQPLPQANRNRAAERAIAALEATCDHCGEATTRGTKATHMRVCPGRPIACTGAAVGCGWSGVAAEQAAHRAVCPFVICLRVVAPLQAQNQHVQAKNLQLQAECASLHARVAQNEEMQAQNQLLQARVAVLEPLVAALQPLAGRVRALEGDAEAGGQRQRQRIGPAPHDAPPSSAAVTQMGLVAAVAALRAHVAVAQVAVVACNRVAELCLEEGNRQLAVEVGAFEAVVAALQAHLQAVGVQKQGCRALRNMCCGTDTAGLARKQRAAEAGALEAVAAAMQAHPQVVGVQEHGCVVLFNLSNGTVAAALARKQRAVQAGGPEVAAAALRAHPGDAEVQRLGQLVIDLIR